MKNSQHWKPTKFILKNNTLLPNPKYISSGSMYIGKLLAEIAHRKIKKYAKGSLLDLGCGTVPMFEVYKEQVSKITCVDWHNSLHDTEYIDYSRDLNLPLELNETFDTILMSDVLEHIYEPKNLLKECYHILNHEGIIILNTPFAYWEHEKPHDYYRYTSCFYEKVAEELNFEVIEIEAYGEKNIDVIKDIISKTYHKDIESAEEIMSQIEKSLKIVNINLPLGYFVILRKC